MTSSTQNAISRVSNLGLEQTLRRQKANSKIFKVMFHKNLLIPMFSRSKETSFASCPNGYILFSFFHCFTHFPFSFRKVHPNKGLSRPDGRHSISILILISSFIRFRSLETINTYIQPPETQIWIICKFLLIKSLRVEFFPYFPSNPRSALVF